MGIVTARKQVLSFLLDRIFLCFLLYCEALCMIWVAILLSRRSHGYV